VDNAELKQMYLQSYEQLKVLDLPHVVHVVREIEVKIVMFEHYDYLFDFSSII
jgi:hypothetical protein